MIARIASRGARIMGAAALLVIGSAPMLLAQDPEPTPWFDLAKLLDNTRYDADVQLQFVNRRCRTFDIGPTLEKQLIDAGQLRQSVLEAAKARPRCAGSDAVDGRGSNVDVAPVARRAAAPVRPRAGAAATTLINDLDVPAAWLLDEYRTPTGSCAVLHAPGAYVVKVSPGGRSCRMMYGDVLPARARIDVSFQLAFGSEGRALGVYFAANSTRDDSFSVWISARGNYRVTHQIGQRTAIIQDWTPAVGLHTDDAANTMSIDIVGSAFSVSFGAQEAARFGNQGDLSGATGFTTSNVPSNAPASETRITKFRATQLPSSLSLFAVDAASQSGVGGERELFRDGAAKNVWAFPASVGDASPCSRVQLPRGYELRAKRASSSCSIDYGTMLPARARFSVVLRQLQPLDGTLGGLTFGENPASPVLFSVTLDPAKKSLLVSKRGANGAWLFYGAGALRVDSINAVTNALQVELTDDRFTVSINGRAVGTFPSGNNVLSGRAALFVQSSASTGATSAVQFSSIRALATSEPAQVGGTLIPLQQSNATAPASAPASSSAPISVLRTLVADGFPNGPRMSRGFSDNNCIVLASAGPYSVTAVNGMRDCTIDYPTAKLPARARWSARLELPVLADAALVGVKFGIRPDERDYFLILLEPRKHQVGFRYVTSQRVGTENKWTPSDAVRDDINDLVVDFIDKKFTVRVNGTAVFEADLVDPPTGTTAVFVVPSNDLQRGGKSNVLVSSVRISELK